MFSHISLERKCFWLAEDVEDVFMYWFCRLDSSYFSYWYFSLWLRLPVPCRTVDIPSPCFWASFCIVPSAAPLVHLKFYASTGCVRIGLASILSCRFVWVCVCVRCVCVCMCVRYVCGCVCVVLLLPDGSLQCVLIDVASSLAASCIAAPPSPPEVAAAFLYSFATPRTASRLFTSHTPPFSCAAYNQFKCAAVHCKKFLFCFCRLNRNVQP